MCVSFAKCISVFTPCKRIRNRESSKYLLLESGVHRWFGIRNPLWYGIRNPLWYGFRNPESWNPESRTFMDSLTWGEVYYYGQFHFKCVCMFYLAIHIHLRSKATCRCNELPIKMASQRRPVIGLFTELSHVQGTECVCDILSPRRRVT